MAGPHVAAATWPCSVPILVLNSNFVVFDSATRALDSQFTQFEMLKSDNGLKPTVLRESSNRRRRAWVVEMGCIGMGFQMQVGINVRQAPEYFETISRNCVFLFSKIS